MEVDTAMRREALQTPAITGYVSDRVWRNTLNTRLEGTGLRALVLHRRPGWATPDTVNTQEFPVVWTDAYADNSRDEFGNPAADDAEDKAFALARAVERTFHAKRGVVWGRVGSASGLMIVSCVRGREPELFTARGARTTTDGDLPPTVVYVRTWWNLIVANGPIG